MARQGQSCCTSTVFKMLTAAQFPPTVNTRTQLLHQDLKAGGIPNMCNAAVSCKQPGKFCVSTQNTPNAGLFTIKQTAFKTWGLTYQHYALKSASI
jgi:hypothetical protein